MVSTPIGRNLVFQIYNADGTEFTGLVMRKSTVESVVMSLGDKITGDVYYKDNSLAVTMHEYIEYNGVKYVLVNPPTVVREGMVSDNSELKGMTKYSFVFYHPMCQLGNFPFCDVAVSSDENMYLSENKIFSWIGKPDDYIAKLNKNLSGTQWIVVKSSRFPSDKDDELSDVIPFNNATVAEAIKTFYDTWGVPYIIDKVDSTESYYAQDKRFKVVFGLPSNEIYESDSDRQLNRPFVFKFGQGVGLKNNSRSPRNNKIVTRISGYGAERNIPYGYPQIPWYGDQRWEYTKYVNNDPQIDSEGVPHGTPTADAYPLYMGIVGGVNTKLIKHPFTRSYLMPSIYSQTVFNKVSPYVSGGGANPNYNPNITLVDYYDAIASQQYPYPNEINPHAPSYESHQFEDIYPELGSASITGAVPLDNNLQPASNWDDTMDDDGNYIQSYFQITLPQLTFDLYACAAITQEMEINMRSGACIGCTFPVEVDWDLYKANFYGEDGKFDPVIGAGHPRDPQKFPDSSAGSISVVVKKENTTFGTLMPNTYQHPVSGDEFVVLGISLPLSYITSAEQRLDESMKSYMLENNVYYFDYPLKFDEYWLVNHGYVLSQIRPNSIIRFEYAGTQLALYVKQLAVKYGENVLPQYDITLTDNVEVILNQIGRVAEDVEKLSSLISILRENYNRSVWAEIAKKLSKVDDDTASGFIRFMKGLQVGSRFVSGLLGEGGVFRKNADGRTYLEVDEMYVRLKAYFDTVEIREYQHSHGGRVASSAGIKVSHVVPYGHYTDQQAGIDEDVPLDDSGNYHLVDPTTGEETLVQLTTKFYRCYYRAKDGDNTTQNSFQVGDLARCHIVDASQGLSMKDYWRAVVGTNEYNTFYNDEYGWTDLSNELTVTVTKGANSKLVVGYMSGSSTPEQGDDLFQLGNLFEQGRRGAIMENTTGPNTPSYQVFQDLGLDTRPQEEQSTLFDPYTTTGKNYIDLGYDSGTGHAKLNVIGDAFIGAADNSSYISYSQADKKVRIKAILDLASTFGDGGSTIQSYLTWNQTQINTLLGDINAIQQQIDGSIETWFYDYLPVDLTAQDPRIPLLTVVVEGQTVPCEPYATWYTADNGGTANESYTERNKHLSDIFYDNSTGYAFRFSKIGGTTEAPVFGWVEITDSAVIKALADAARAQDTADNKRRVFVTTPPEITHDDGRYVEYDVGDLWVNASGVFTYVDDQQVTHTVTYDNDLLRCCRAKPIRNSSGVVTDGAFSIADWQLASKYTDDTALLEFLDGYQGTLTDIKGQIDKKAETWYQATDPSSVARPNGWLSEDDAEHYGDLWYRTTDNTTWFFDVRDNGEGADPRYTYYWRKQNIPDAVFDEIDGKCQIFVNNPTATPPSYPTGYQEKDLWILPVAQSGTDEDGNPYNYIEGELLTAKNDMVVALGFRWADWTKKVGYTNDSKFNNYITMLLNGTGLSGDVYAAAAQSAILNALGAGTVVDGGLLLTSLIGMRKYDATTQQYVTWAGISGQYDDWSGNTRAKGHGIAAWYGGAMVDKEDVSVLPASYAKSLFRFDGSGYLAGGNITWDENGVVTIANVYSDVNGTPVAWSGNTLQYMTNLQNLLPITVRSSVTYLDPQVSFANLSVVHDTGFIPANNSVLNYGEMLTRFVPLVPLGSIDGFNKIELTAGATAGNGGAIYFHYNGMSNRSSGYIINDADGVVSVYAPTGNIGLKVGTQNGDYIQIGNIRIGYDSANNALEIYKLENNVHAAANIYARGGVSALGYGSGGSGGGGVGDVTWEALAGQASGGHTIHHSYIDNVLLSYATESYVQSYVQLNAPHELSDLNDVVISSASHGDILTYNAVVVSPSTPHWKNTSKSAFLSGYATETWVGNNYYISNGTIYMNGQSITPSSIVGNYLPLSGGTLSSSNSSAVLNINSSAGTETNITIQRSGTLKAVFGYMDGGYVYMYNATRGNYLKYFDDGTLTFENQTVIHSGNIASQSVAYATSAGNADTVDNLHASSFVYTTQVSEEQNSDVDTWAQNNADANHRSLVYNTLGTEWSYLSSLKTNGAYGAIIKFGYGSGHPAAYLKGKGGGSWYSGWVQFITSDNIGSQSVNYANSAQTLYTSDTSQRANDCYKGTAGLHFYRTNGGDIGNDGFILQWSWNVGSVGQQLYLDDNPSGIMMIRGYHPDTQTFGSWYRIYTDAYHPDASDADTLDGYHEGSFQRAVATTQRDFPDGTLITTNIDYSVTDGEPFYVEIKGNTFSRHNSCFTQVQGYIYNNTIINYGVSHLGIYHISGIVAMNVDGYLCFWFPRQSYWEGYSIAVYSAYDYRVNRVTSITNSTEPSGTKRVDLSSNTHYTITSENISSQTVSNSDTVDGEHASAFLHLSGGTMTGGFFATGISGAGYSNRLIFRHVDGQNCDGDYSLYLQYFTALNVYIGNAGHCISDNGSYYTGRAAMSDKLAYQSVVDETTVDDFHEGAVFKTALYISSNTSIAGCTNGIILSGGYSNATYGFQMFIDDDPTGIIALRQRSTNWSAWRNIPLGDGTGASGTWAISITGNSDTCDGLHVHGGRNNEANKIVRTDSNGYIQCGYINSSSGDEANNSSPARVWGTNGSDSYLRTYLTSALSVNYAAYAGQLYTARSIWGNSFDGAADITGELKAYSRARFGYGAGSATINSDSYSVFVGTNQTRIVNSGLYYAGIAFNHMILYNGGDGYLYHPQGWIGLRLYDTIGSERSSLVFATKESHDRGDTDHPVERMCIDPFGNVGIGTTSPSQKLDVSGNIYASGNVASGNMLSCSANLSVGTSAIIGTTLSVGSWISASGTIYGNSGAQITGEISATSHITSGGNVTCKNVYSSASSGSIGGFNNIQLNYQADTYPADGGGIYFHWSNATSYSSAYIRHDSNNHLQILGYTSGFGVQVGSQNNDYLQVGGVRLVYDSANNALKVVGSDGSSAANFYATGAVSALGANTSGGGGTGISYKSTGNITLASNTWYRIASIAGTSNVGTSSFRIYSVSGNRTFSSKVILSLRGSSADLIKEGSCNRVIGDLRITTDGTNTYLEVKTGYNGSGIVIKADTYEDYSDLDNSLYGWTMYQSAVIGGGTEICATSDDGRTLTFSGSVYCTGEFNSGGYYCSSNIYSEGDITTENDIWASGDVHAYSFINSSDARLKDIQDYEATIDLYTLAYAPAIHFKWNNRPDTRTHVGTIAQYWQGVMPEVISESKDGYLSMQYDVLAMLAAISVAKKVVDHERRIMELEEENAYLRYEINQLKKVA